MPDNTHLEPALRAGLKWLYETSQPDGAILQHHGESLIVWGANRTLRFVPTAWEHHVVIVLDVTNVAWGSGYQEPPSNPLKPGELADLAEHLNRTGHHVCNTWNGAGITGSIALAQPAHKSLRAAVDRYHSGCPAHPSRSVFCKCGWYREGNQKVIKAADVAAELAVSR